MRGLTLLLAVAALLAAAAPAHARKAVRVVKPSDRAAVSAHPHLRSTAALISLKGRSKPNATLLVRARCALGPCTTYATANRRGRWRATLHAIVDSGKRRMGIRVAYTDLGNEASDLVVVSLARPAWAQDTQMAGPELAMIGDSLAEGTDVALREELDGWWATTDGRRSRPLADGMAVLEATPLPRDPVVLAFSLFTNDDPRRVDDLEAAVRRSVALLEPGGCAIWATIVRPKVGGVSYRAANQRLRSLQLELGPALKLVDWARAVRRHRDWIREDGVHATPEGYAGRAALYAAAARSCDGVA